MHPIRPWQYLPGSVLALLVAIAGCSQEPAIPPDGMPGFPAYRTSASDGAKASLWTLVTSPNSPPTYGVYDDMLYAVSGTSAKDVWAVGDDCCYAAGTQEYYHALFTHWNGSAWRIVPFPKDEPADTYLRGVSALSSNDAWAVGYAPYPNDQAVFEHWDGKKWSVVSSPYIYNNGEMNAVAAISKNDVWAAGEGNFAAVLEHWNGTAWSFVPGYTYGLTILTSVSATGPNDVWAVGLYYGEEVYAFSEHWNGTAWTYVPPANDFFSSSLSGVTAISPTDAWAVGYEMPSEQSQVPQTLIEHWDGSKWSVVPSPDRDPKGSYILNNTLYGVAARSPNDAWAVGFWTYYPGDGTTRSLFLHWNGRAWRTEPGPPQLESSDNAADNELLGIAKLRTGELWAVGNQSIPPACCSETLTVHTAPR